MIKEKINNLVKEYGNDNDTMDMIHDTLDSFSEYVKAVNELETTIAVARFRLSPEDYRQRITNLDRNRRIIHNGVIAGVKFLNRLSKSVNLELFFDGNTSDRNEIAQFALSITNELFNNATTH